MGFVTGASKGSTGRTPAAAQKKASTSQPLANVPEISADADRKSQSKAKEGSEQGTEFWSPLYGYRLKVTDTLLVGITFLLFLATFALWLATRKLVRGAEDTAERQLRAYVFTSSIQVLQFSSIPRITVSYKNFGQTPCHEMIFSLNIEISDVPLAKDLCIGPSLPTAPLAPGNSFHTDALFQITPEQRSAIEEGRAGIYIFGRIEYRDVFKEPRHTNFRLIFQGDPQGRTGICKEGNEYS